MVVLLACLETRRSVANPEIGRAISRPGTGAGPCAQLTLYSPHVTGFLNNKRNFKINYYKLLHYCVISGLEQYISILVSLKK